MGKRSENCLTGTCAQANIGYGETSSSLRSDVCSSLLKGWEWGAWQTPSNGQSRTCVKQLRWRFFHSFCAPALVLGSPPQTSQGAKSVPRWSCERAEPQSTHTQGGKNDQIKLRHTVGKRSGNFLTATCKQATTRYGETSSLCDDVWLLTVMASIHLCPRPKPFRVRGAWSWYVLQLHQASLGLQAGTITSSSYQVSGTLYESTVVRMYGNIGYLQGTRASPVC